MQLIVTLNTKDLAKIANGLQDSADNNATVQVMIQEDGIKFRDNRYGSWSPPYGEVIVRAH